MLSHLRRTFQVFTVGVWIVSLTATPAFAQSNMRIISAYYGSNCSSANYRPDPQYPQNSRNVTFLLEAALGWTTQMESRRGSHPQVVSSGYNFMVYRIDHRVLGDPALSCPKTFVVRYWCSVGSRTLTARIEAEASGQNVALDCR